jgi:8-oxo-dGTP pyrophosphatase MutT (NUDIX family)
MLVGEIRGPWTINSERIGYENPWMCVTEYDVTRPDGKPGLYGVVTPKHLALAILPIDTHGYVTLVGQYRFALKRYSWEIPEGGGHLDGDPQACAARELREETGLLASDWREIMRLDLSNCITDERAIGYLATGLTEGEADPDDTEVLETRRLHFRDALAELHAGEIEDALTVAMLLRAYYMASEGHFDAALTAAMLDV